MPTRGQVAHPGRSVDVIGGLLAEGGQVLALRAGNATIHESRAARWSVALLAVAAGALAWALSARLAGTAVSIGYLISARSFSVGDGLVSPDGGTYTLYGPLYPVLLALVSKAGMSLFTAARVISALSLAASAVFAGLWTRRITGSWLSAALGGAAAIALWPALMTRYVWSEPLFIAVILAMGWCLTIALQRSSHLWLAAAGTLLGIGIVTRYAGLVLGLVIVYVAAVWHGSWRSRATAALALGLPAAVITGAWVMRNLAVNADEPLGPRPASTLSLGGVLDEVTHGVAGLVTPPGVPFALQLVTLALAGVGLAWALVAVRGRLPWAWWRVALVPFLLSGLYLVGNVYAALTTRLDSLAGIRLVVPCFPLAAVGAVAVMWKAVSMMADPGWRTHNRPRLAVSLLAGPPLLILLVAAGATVRYGPRLQPRERLSPAIAESEVFAAAAALHGARLVSNNETDAAWVLDRAVLPSPTHRGDPQADIVPGEVDFLSHLTGASPTVLIWTDQRDSLRLDLDQIQDMCDLELLSTHADGELYGVRSCEVDP
jgi:hypothetical protein